MSEPRTAAGRALLRYARGLPPLFLTPTWANGILAIEAEARADTGERFEYGICALSCGHPGPHDKASPDTGELARLREAIQTELDAMFPDDWSDVRAHIVRIEAILAALTVQHAEEVVLEPGAVLAPDGELARLREAAQAVLDLIDTSAAEGDDSMPLYDVLDPDTWHPAIDALRAAIRGTEEKE